jgi:hypothetical protein
MRVYAKHKRYLLSCFRMIYATAARSFKVCVCACVRDTRCSMQLDTLLSMILKSEVINPFRYTGGDAGEGFLATASCPDPTEGMTFSTYDKYNVGGCATARNAGWWYSPSTCYCRTCFTCTGSYNGYTVVVRRMMIKPAD